MMCKNKVKENEAIHLKIIITGKGNINLIDAPGIIFPPEFETYDPKVTENVSVSGIVSGTKTYDYLIIPRKAGNYTINDFGFSFFDAEKKQFITIASPEFNVIIEPGEKNSSAELSAFDSSNPIEERQNDIRYIKNGDLELTPMNNEFFGSMLHFSILGALLLSFVLTAGIFQYNKKLGKDIVLLKERRALKLAKKQLSIANKYKIQNEKVKFYSEILIGLNQFISDKFNIPLSDLSRDRIKNEMAVRKMPDSISNDYVALMESCEFVKYAPGSLPDQLDSSYDRAISLITSIEKQLKS